MKKLLSKLKLLLWLPIIFFILSFVCCWLHLNIAKAKPPKHKFYDFSDQLIDGHINKPSTLYTDAKNKVKFDRLINLKKSFLPKLFATSKEKVFK